MPRAETMNSLTTSLTRFLKDETGATAIEYAIIAGGLSIVIVAAVRGIGSTLNTTFASVQTAVK
jgi:pilus assembly protein Flp/PilA